MKLEGNYLFDAAIADVWAALFDPEVLAAAMPGCEKLEREGDELVGTMTIKVGPISGKFTGKVKVEDKVEPTSYKMIVDGRGTPGFVKATVLMSLAAEGSGTRLTYNADAQIGGKIATVGERLVDASARAIAKQSLDNLHENIKIRAAAHKPAPSAEPPAASAEVAPAVEVAPVPETPADPDPAASAARPQYKRADANAMAKSVAAAAFKSMLPLIIGALVALALIIWWIAR